MKKISKQTEMNKLFKQTEESFRSTKKLAKGKSACYCGKNNCKTDAYWRLDDEEYCDRHLPLEGRMLFLLNKWTKTSDKDLEYADTSDSDSDSDTSVSDSRSD